MTDPQTKVCQICGKKPEWHDKSKHEDRAARHAAGYPGNAPLRDSEPQTKVAGRQAANLWKQFGEMLAEMKPQEELEVEIPPGTVYRLHLTAVTKVCRHKGTMCPKCELCWSICCQCKPWECGHYPAECYCRRPDRPLP